MGSEISVITVAERERWTAELGDGGLPCQSWSHAWALQASGVNAKLAVIRTPSARMIIPFFERTWMGSTDIATVVGLSGASIIPNSPEPLSAWHEYATARGWVAGYLQLSMEVDLGGCPVNGQLVASNAVFMLDLSTNVIGRASRIVHRKIRHSEMSGAVLVEDRNLLAEALKCLYPLKMDQVGAKWYYKFSPETLRRWVHDPQSVGLGAMIDGEIVAVSVCRVGGRHAEHHISASNDKGNPFTAWLIAKSIPHLQQRGAAWLNLGGGIRPGDGIYSFKERFGGTARPLMAVRQIYDEKRYAELCRLSGASPAAPRFPAYRSGEC